MTHCTSCGKPIIWASTVNDKRIPIDRQPDPKGLFVLRADRNPPPRDRFRGAPPAYLAIAAADARPVPSETEPRFTSHFATCPHAAQHRSRHGREVRAVQEGQQGQQARQR